MGDGGDEVGALPVEALAAAAGAQHDGHLLDRPTPAGPLDPRGHQHLGAARAGSTTARGCRPGCGARRTAGWWGTTRCRPGRAARAPRRGGCRRPASPGSIAAAAAETRVTCPSASATTTPSGSASARAWAASRSVTPVTLTALGARRGVEADRGGRGEVEALGPAVDRDPDPVVGGRGQLGGQAPGLVAEQPGRRAGEQLVGVVEVDLAGAVGRERRSGRRPGRRRPPSAGSAASATGRWNRLPTVARTVLGL